MTLMKFCRIGDGRTISYREQGTGPVLVMLHGWGMSSNIFSNFMHFLTEEYRMLAPDLRGHGRSDPGTGYSLENLAGDVEEWLDAMHITEFYLLGWSLGGMVALELVEHLKNRPAKLILLSTTPCFVRQQTWTAGQPRAQVKILARQFRRDSHAALDSFFISQFDGDGFDGEQMFSLRRELLDISLLPGKDAGLGGLDTLMHADLRHRLGSDIPTLVMHGDRDAIIPAAAGKYLSTHLPDAQWLELEHTGHAPFISHPQRCADAIRSFLQ
jgi:pimeloyl-[acyl-carrier protein] methyl ester esterase